jgi:hypothetical protein
MQQVPEISGDFGGPSVSGHHPQKRRCERLPGVPLDDHHAVLVSHEPPKFVGDHLSSNTAA